MGYSGCPRMKEIEAQWCGSTAVTSIQKQEKAFVVRVKIGSKALCIKVTFPALGGVRITETAGFFAYEDTLPIAYSGKKNLRAAAGENAVVFRRDDGQGFLLDVQKDGKTVLTLSGDSIAFGLVGNKIKRIAKFKFSAPFADGEMLYGLGERYNRLNQVGCRAYLWNLDTAFGKDVEETYQNIPLLHSTAGYTLFFNNMYGGWADFGVEKAHIYSFEYTGPHLDVFILTGTPVENLDGYTQITGRPILPPKWAYQYWMGGGLGAWKYGGKTYAENLREYLDGYADMGIHHVAACYGETGPCQTEECYEMLKESGCRMLFWNWPGLINEFRDRVLGDLDYSKMTREQVLTLVGKAVLGSDAIEDQPYPKLKKNGKWILADSWFDFTHPNVHKLLKARFDMFFKWGLKGSMVDFGEFIKPEWQLHNGKDGNTFHNEHAYWYGKAMNELFKEYCGDDHVLFQRAGCAGSQHWTVHFGGDQSGNSKGLQQACVGLVTAAASGMPTWGSDIAGLGGTPSSETYVRWAQHGAFSPLMRAHAGGLGSNPWNYGDTAIEVFKRMFWWRENMLPYIYSHAVKAHKTGSPIAYPMVMLFPDDAARAAEDQYMFGEELLVAPVMLDGLNWRMVTFPKGNWVNLFTGEVIEGGRTLYVQAPLDTIPVYVREGAAMVLTVPADTLATCENMEDVKLTSALMVAPASSKRTFTHYEDDNTAYGFVTDKVGDEAVTVENVDGMDIGGLIVNGVEAARVLVDGKEAAFTVQDGRTLVKLTGGFKKAQIW